MDEVSVNERMTMPTRLVLSVFLENPGRELHGYEIARLTGPPVATIYSVLERQAERGRLTARIEDRGETGTMRPLRKYYRLTAEGEALARRVRVPVPGIPDRRGS